MDIAMLSYTLLYLCSAFLIATGRVSNDTSASWRPPPCTFDSYVVSPEPIDHCSIKQVCSSMNAEHASFLAPFQGKVELRSALEQCFPVIPSVWLLIIKSYTEGNASYGLVIKELNVAKRYYTSDKDCRSNINTCAGEPDIDSEFCGPDSTSDFTCCDAVSHALCTDLDECLSGNVTCEVPAEWPCQANLTCRNSVGGYNCLLPAPEVSVDLLLNSTALLTCSSCDPCVSSIEYLLPYNNTYTWFADDRLEQTDAWNQVFVQLTNVTVTYKCMMTIDGIVSLNSSLVSTDNITEENTVMCHTDILFTNNTESEQLFTAETPPSDLERETTTHSLELLTTEQGQVEISSSTPLEVTASSAPQDNNLLSTQTDPEEITTSSLPKDETTLNHAQDVTSFLSFILMHSTMSNGFTDSATTIDSQTLTPESVLLNVTNTSPSWPESRQPEFVTTTQTTTSSNPIFMSNQTASPPFTISEETTTRDIIQPGQDDSTSSSITTNIPLNLHLTPSVERVSAGSSVLLDCSLTGSDFLLPVYSWYQDGALVFVSDENTLTINNFNTPNVGVYVCQANVSMSGGQVVSTFSNTMKITLLTRFQTCPCPCSNTSFEVDLTPDQVDAGLRSIVSDLGVDVTSLDSTVRRKTSASDSRPVAQFLGALSVITMLSFMVLIVASDFLSVCVAVYGRFKGETNNKLKQVHT